MSYARPLSVSTAPSSLSAAHACPPPPPSASAGSSSSGQVTGYAYPPPFTPSPLHQEHWTTAPASTAPAPAPAVVEAALGGGEELEKRAQQVKEAMLLLNSDDTMQKLGKCLVDIVRVGSLYVRRLGYSATDIRSRGRCRPCRLCRHCRQCSGICASPNTKHSNASLPTLFCTLPKASESRGDP